MDEWNPQWLSEPRWHCFYGDVRLADLEAKPACYVVFGDGVVQYVGSSRNVKARMCGRMPKWTNWETDVQTIWGTFATFELRVRYSTKYGDWLMRELRLIKRLRPLHNAAGEGAQRKIVVIRGRHARKR